MADLILRYYCTHTNKEGGKELLVVVDIFMEWTVRMASWVYTYHQTHQIVCIKDVQLFAHQSYLKKKKKTKRILNQHVYSNVWYKLCLVAIKEDMK